MSDGLREPKNIASENPGPCNPIKSTSALLPSVNKQESLNTSCSSNKLNRADSHDPERSKPDPRKLELPNSADAVESSDPHDPENVFTNLIIIEHALRSQFMELQRSRRRGFLFFWGVLLGAVVLTYRVRYDPSFYRVLRLIEQLLMIAFYISAGLFFLTGMYAKVFVVAPRFLADTNKGLKALNFRLVKTPTSLKEKLVASLINPVYSEDPAGPVKLILSPREFPPQYIEDWEIFRDDYWDRQRRRRKRLKNRRKEKKSEH